MGWLTAIGAALKVAWNFLTLQSKQQERDNAPDIVANKDAARDQKEKEKIQQDVEQGDKTGNLDKERQDWG